MNAAADSNVIEAEVIEDNKTLHSRPAYVEIPHRAAATIEAVADAIGTISPEHAEKLHGHARSVRGVTKSVEQVAIAGGEFTGSVKGLMDKLGIKPEFHGRDGVRGPRPTVADVRARYRAARDASRRAP